MDGTFDRSGSFPPGRLSSAPATVEWLLSRESAGEFP